MGLMKAIEKFDPNKGAFITYAIIWIKSEILTHIRKNKFLIKLPSNMSQLNF